jgi:hypothetical protein
MLFMQFIRLLTTSMAVLLGGHLISSCSGKGSLKSPGRGGGESGAKTEIEISGSISVEEPVDFVQTVNSVSIGGVNLTNPTSYEVTAYSIEPRGFRKLIFTGSFAEPKFSFKSTVARQYLLIEITRLPDGGQFGAVLPPPASGKKASMVVDGATTIAAKMATLIASKAESGDQAAQQALTSGSVSVADLLMVAQSVRTTVNEQKEQNKGSAIDLSSLAANLISKSNERMAKLTADGQSSAAVAEKLSEASYQTIFGDDAKVASAGVLAYRVNPDLGGSEAAKTTVAYEAIKASGSDSMKPVDEAFRVEATAYRTATSVVEAVAAKTAVVSGFKEAFDLCMSSPSNCAQTSYTPPQPQASGIEPAKAPGAPTLVTGTAGDGQVELTWIAPASDGGASITDYVIQYSSDSGSNWTTFADGTSNSTGATVTGLTNGTAYVFRVVAKNSTGTGNYSSNSPSVTPVTTPGATTAVIGTPGDAQVSLTWSAPSSDGGASITDYVVQYSSDSGSNWTTFADGTSNSTGATVTGLTNGTAYVFRVVAKNSTGTGNYSANSPSVTPTAPVAACSNSVSADRPNDCYLEGSSPNYAQGLDIGTERQGPDGTVLTLVAGAGVFKVWKEKGGSRILNATGLVVNGWQKELTDAGNAFSTTDFITDSNIAGRVCPTHVFLSHTNMTATGRCLYYDAFNSAQALDLAGTSGAEASDWLQHWDRGATGRGNGSSYYEGNIKTCADKGMRLPTIYEVAGQFESYNTDYLPTADLVSNGGSLNSHPSFAGANGVPNDGYWFWTASAWVYPNFTNVYWGWAGYSFAQAPFTNYYGNASVRCVLPDNSQ